jgi:hypothetical protein
MDTKLEDILPVDDKEKCVKNIQFLNCHIPVKDIEFHRMRIEYHNGGWMDYYYLEEHDFEELIKQIEQKPLHLE